MRKKTGIFIIFIMMFSGILICLGSQDLLTNLASPKKYTSKRISSFDRSGGNSDALPIKPGETKDLALIEGPAAIHHIWVTISAEPFYGRKIILRMYWDNEKHPSVEAPIGDFFGVGHGLNRNLSSLPIANSSQGRARNCYWYMPFRKSARITATNEGSQTVGSFYYYIDYRELPNLESGTPYFHTQYYQETPCKTRENYLILDAKGKGHYIGCNLSILQRALGWWGEGDDKIYVDGEEFPSLYGTGSEDYFSDAWGMREDENLFYGCPLQEPDFKTGSKATVYRFHIPDPIPFKKSIRVTIEHGHDNNRADYFSSCAYWYQTEPHKPFPELFPVKDRLPFAIENLTNFRIPNWKKIQSNKKDVFRDARSGAMVRSDRLNHFLTSFYDHLGERFPALMTENAEIGTLIEITQNVEIGEYYDLHLFFLRGPLMGKFIPIAINHKENSLKMPKIEFDGYSEKRKISFLTLKDIRLFSGKNTLVLKVDGPSKESNALQAGFIGLNIIPTQRRFISQWNLIGPFNAPDMTYLQVPYPPERETNLNSSYIGKDQKTLTWKKIEADENGFIRLESRIDPPERGLVYGLVYILSPEKKERTLMIGSDDGIRIWLNEKLVFTNPAYRGAYPDQDKINVTLEKGWNKLLIKVLQGAGGWGFYVRFVDPEKSLKWGLEAE